MIKSPRHSLHLLLCFALALVPIALGAQEAPAGRVRVVILDDGSGDRLTSSMVRIADGANNLLPQGEGSFETAVGEIRLTAVAPGYIDFVQMLTVQPGATLEIEVRMQRLQVRERVSVVAVGEPAIEEPTVSLKPDDVFNVAGALDNPFRALQALPGVAAPDDFGSRLSVRGGGPDQNLTLMDGVEIHNPYRVFGLTSAFNPETVDRFNLTAGGFSARYGDRLSSLFIVDTRPGRPAFAGAAALSVTDANVVAEGALPGRPGNSWLLTARRTYYDIVARAFTDNDLPQFGDLQGRFDVGLGRGRLTLTGVRSRENTDLSIEENDEGERADALAETRNDLVSLRYLTPVGNSITSNTTLAWYRNQELLDFDGDLRADARRSNAPDDDIAVSKREVIFGRRLNVEDLSLRQELTWQANDRHVFDFGFEYHDLESGVFFETLGDRNEDEANGSSIRGGVGLPDELASVINGSRFGAWVEDAINVGTRWTVKPGVRFDWSAANERTTLSPRLAIDYLVDTRTRLRVSGGLFSQSPGYEKLISADYFIDLSRAAELGLRHATAWHAIVGLQRQLGNGFSFSAEAYYKKFDDLLIGRLETEPERLARVARYDFPDELQGSVPAAPIITSNPTTDATGSSYGIDLFLSKDPGSGPLYGWLSYTFGRAEQTAYGRTYAFDYDRRHALSLVANYLLGRKWEFSVTGRYSSGFPFTEPVGLRVAAVEDPNHDPDSELPPALVPETDANGNLVYAVDYGDTSNLNSGRLPYYMRLDARVTFRPGGPAGAWSVYLEVLNVLNRDNAGTLEPLLSYNPDGPLPGLTLQPGEALPLLPSFGVRFRF
jgi:hypothetical protein